MKALNWSDCHLKNIKRFFRNSDDPDQPQTYTLTFTLTFPHDDDEVYLANCYPYTYSDLQVTHAKSATS